VGVFEAFFEALAALSATTHLVQMFNSPIVRAHVPGRHVREHYR
jgi:hypothetical protein